MLRFADQSDLTEIQAILNAPDNWAKLEAYSDEELLAAINDASAAVFIWQEESRWHGFCWLQKTPEGSKIEEFGVTAPGRGIGSHFFSSVILRAEFDGYPAPLWLNVAADNTQAIRFYERFGFVGTSLKKAVWRRRTGPIADALTMTLTHSKGQSLTPGDQNVT